MKRTLLAALLTFSQLVYGAESRVRFHEVLAVQPDYVKVDCDPNICQELPDNREIGFWIYYKCKGEYYQTWSRIRIEVGMLIKAVDCSNVVVVKQGVPVTKHP